MISKNNLYVAMYIDNAYNMTGVLESDIDKMIVHSGFDCWMRSNDIAILTLRENFNCVEQFVQVSKRTTSIDETGIIAGFGKLYEVSL